jgi:hypothetical protein
MVSPSQSTIADVQKVSFEVSRLAFHQRPSMRFRISGIRHIEQMHGPFLITPKIAPHRIAPQRRQQKPNLTDIRSIGDASSGFEDSFLHSPLHDSTK